MDVSVITVTFGRLDILRRKLESLAAQTLPPERFELVLCVNADPETLRAVKNLEPPFALAVVAFEQRQGVSAARNACVNRASGELLYFSDDDALLNPDTLGGHLAFHRSQARDLAAVGGVDWEHGGRTERMRPQRVDYWNLHGVNTSLPKTLFERVGGFPEWLSGYGFEDVLFGYALKRLGIPIIALPEVSVRHLGANPLRGKEPAKARSAGRNAVRAVREHPELAFRLGVHPLSLAFKRLALEPPLDLVWKLADLSSYRYERAFLQGALEEKRHARR